MKHFARRSLAAELATALSGQLAFSDAPNGLFLAAPRRTGKSTFLQLDLKPELERRGVCVVYVDFWGDQRRDPGQMIAEAIARSLRPHLGVVSRAAKASAVEKVAIAGVKIDLARLGAIDGTTLPDALQTLFEKSGGPVALIVDEAQQALTSEAGENAMAALKSARDQMNTPGRVNLMLIMSGSDRDKLLRLVNTNSAAFYGSQVQHMPKLGPDFIEHVATLIEAQRPELKSVDRVLLEQAFATFGHRPQFFITALESALSPLAALRQPFELELLAAAETRRQEDEQQMDSEYSALKPLEQAVLWRMLEVGPRFRPYDADALRFYKQQVGANVSAAKAQGALENLRARSPALVWKSARGEYSLDDVAMLEWFKKRKTEGHWPPKSEADSLDEDR